MIIEVRIRVIGARRSAPARSDQAERYPSSKTQSG
jgi:hypothetical protein